MLRKALIVLTPVLLVFGAILISGLLVATRDAPERRAETGKARLVTVETVTAADTRAAIRSQGAVTPRTQTSLVSEVAGVVESVSPDFVAGGFFERGDVLLQIDPSDYEAGVKRAEAELAAARAALERELAQAEQARKDWASLGRASEPSALVLRKPYVDEARARVQAAEAELALARRDLERTRIRAPYDGLVREKAADVGQYVTVGTRLGQTFAVDYAEVRLPLSSEQRALVDVPSATRSGEGRPGPMVRLQPTSGPAQDVWRARIVRSEGVVDADARVVYVVAQIHDPYRQSPGTGGNQRPLEIGTFVSAEIEGREFRDVYPVPRSALTTNDEVLLVDAETRLRIRPVEVVWSSGDTAYVRAELDEPVRVVTSALEAPVDGMSVRLPEDETLNTGNAEAVAQADATDG